MCFCSEDSHLTESMDTCVCPACTGHSRSLAGYLKKPLLKNSLDRLPSFLYLPPFYWG